MGKNPSFVLLTFLLFACIPFFVTCDETKELDDLEKGLKSLKNIMVEYQAEFDAKGMFVQLHEAIDVIKFDMGSYRGKARNKIETIATLNSQVRQNYIASLSPIFEWCVTSSEIFKSFIPYFNHNNLSNNDKKLMLNLTFGVIDSGLTKAMISLKHLDNVQNRTAELANQIRLMLRDVNDDFGPEGFYSRNEMGLEESMKDNDLKRLYFRTSGLINEPIGEKVGSEMGFRFAPLKQWLQKKTYEERKEFIINFITFWLQKIQQETEKVNDTVKVIKRSLEEDKSNLIKLQKMTDADNNDNLLLLANSQLLQSRFASILDNLRNECNNYEKWMY